LISAFVFVYVVCVLLPVCWCQDPAPGWLAYAVGTNPAQTGRLTYIEAKWVVGANPRNSDAFYSPWFGIESSDNLNLIQPVNPWLGDSWSIYNEYYQWSPTYNYNSDMHVVRPGDQLFGSVTFNPANQSYTVYHSDLTDGWSVTSVIAVQQKGNTYKNYTMAYFVYEKVNDCNSYPPDGSVTFSDILMQFDDHTVTPSWKTGVVDEVCDFTAHVVDSATIQITWNPNAPNPSKDKYQPNTHSLHPKAEIN